MTKFARACLKVERDTDGSRSCQAGVFASLAEVLQQHIAAQRVTDRDDRAVMAVAELFQELADVAGLTRVIATRQPVPVVAAVAKMHDTGVPALSLRRM